MVDNGAQERGEEETESAPVPPAKDSKVIDEISGGETGPSGTLSSPSLPLGSDS